MKNLILTAIVVASLAIAATAQKKPAPKPEPSSGAVFAATVEHDGAKTEIAGTQFITFDGNATTDGANPNRVNIFLGASNPKDDKNFSFTLWVPRAEKGTFTNDDGAGMTFMSTAFADVPMFIVKSLTVEIDAMPLKGGIVSGTFDAVCQSVGDDGTLKTYKITGNFKARRMS